MAQAQTDLTVRIDTDVMTSVEAFFRGRGMTVSTGINALLKTTLEHGKMPFEVNDPPDCCSTEDEWKDYDSLSDYLASNVDENNWCCPKCGYIQLAIVDKCANCDEKNPMDYSIPYCPKKAEQWAAEDPLFCKETYKQDSFFTKERQAELRQQDEDYEAGRTKSVSWEVVRQRANAIQN